MQVYTDVRYDCLLVILSYRELGRTRNTRFWQIRKPLQHIIIKINEPTTISKTTNNIEYAAECVYSTCIPCTSVFVSGVLSYFFYYFSYYYSLSITEKLQYSGTPVSKYCTHYPQYRCYYCCGGTIIPYYMYIMCYYDVY